MPGDGRTNCLIAAKNFCRTTLNSDHSQVKQLDFMPYLAYFSAALARSGSEMSRGEPRKGLQWIARARDELREFPETVRREVGFALYIAEHGGKAPNAFPLTGFGGASVLEVVSDHDGDTFRAVYTVKFEHAVYVLHCFQKKSRRGIKTPKAEMDLIRLRLKLAQEHHDRVYKSRRETKA